MSSASRGGRASLELTFCAVRDWRPDFHPRGALTRIADFLIIRAMAGTLIDGLALADSIKQQVRTRVAALGKPVHLTAILVGATQAAELYARRQADASCRGRSAYG